MSWYAKNRDQILKKVIEAQRHLFENKIEGKDYVKCHYCEMTSRDLTSHISRIHKIKASEYSKTHPLRAQTYLEEQSERVLGLKNPAYQHGGRLSPFSKKFLKSNHNPKETRKKATKSLIANPMRQQKIEYWLKQTDGNMK